MREQEAPLQDFVQARGKAVAKTMCSNDAAATATAAQLALVLALTILVVAKRTRLIPYCYSDVFVSANAQMTMTVSGEWCLFTLARYMYKSPGQPSLPQYQGTMDLFALHGALDGA